MSPAAILPELTPALGIDEVEAETEPLHVLDLPHISTRPSATLLLTILSAVTIHPRSWDGTTKKLPPSLSRYASLSSAPGLSKWLTSLVSNELRWLGEGDENDEIRERIWEEAGKRLSERCGRVAMPAVTRDFRIPLSRGRNREPVAFLEGKAERRKENEGYMSEGSSGVNSSAASIYGPDQESISEIKGNDFITITLHEPSMTADNLGLKTWGSSYLLARRLSLLSQGNFLPISSPALELGSGTGLVGIACAAVLGSTVTLTDLPEIVPNLQHNVSLNSKTSFLMSPASNSMGDMKVGVLDWTSPGTPSTENDKYPLVLAADPLYSPQHPALLVDVFGKWVRRVSGARVVVEFPLRERYDDVREDFWKRMLEKGFVLVEGGVEVGWDDWGGDNAAEAEEDGEGEGEGGKVRCWWGVYRWKEESLI